MSNKVENLFRDLREDQENIFYAADQISKNLISRARRSYYPKDKVLVNLYNENKNEFSSSTSSSTIPLTTPFFAQKRNVDRSTLYSFKGPFEMLQADIADIRFLAKSAVDPHYCLLIVDLFTNMTYTYPMKKRKQLANKIAEFYEDIKSQRRGDQKIRLQTDLEFQQNFIKKLNEENNVEMYSTKLREGKAFAAEQKIREFKKILLRSKRIIKSRGDRLKPNEIIRKATSNMNKKIMPMYDVAPETILSKSLDPKTGEEFQQIYDFRRIAAVGKRHDREQKYFEKIDRQKRRQLRDPLNIGERVFVLSSRIRKKDAPGNFYKATTENRPYYNRKEIYTIKDIVNIDGIYNYWLNEQKGRFLREELFALNNQFSHGI